MFSQKTTVAFKPSRLARKLSLLWLIAVTTVLAILQWPIELQWFIVIIWGIKLVRPPQPPSFLLDLSKDVLHWQRQDESGALSLLYQTEYWSVVMLHSDPQQSFLKRLQHHLCRYRWLYRDQLAEADYRYLRSRLNVEKLIGLPAQKNESAVSK